MIFFSWTVHYQLDMLQLTSSDFKEEVVLVSLVFQIGFLTASRTLQKKITSDR